MHFSFKAFSGAAIMLCSASAINAEDAPLMNFGEPEPARYVGTKGSDATIYIQPVTTDKAYSVLSAEGHSIVKTEGTPFRQVFPNADYVVVFFHEKDSDQAHGMALIQAFATGKILGLKRPDVASYFQEIGYALDIGPDMLRIGCEEKSGAMEFTRATSGTWKKSMTLKPSIPGFPGWMDKATKAGFMEPKDHAPLTKEREEIVAAAMKNPLPSPCTPRPITAEQIAASPRP